MKRLLLALLAAASFVGAPAQEREPDATDGPFQRIEAARSAGNAALDARAAACYEQFAVEQCLKDVQARRRALEADLKRQEHGLNDHIREQKALDQLRRSEDKRREKLARDTQSQGGELDPAKLQAQQDKQADHAQRAASAPVPPLRPLDVSGPDSAAQARNRVDYAHKLEAAEQKRLEVEKRRAQKPGKTGTALPVPP